jgi:hypothetical protein
VSADLEIDGWLDALGYALTDSRARARAALEEGGLTRAGKTRMSVEKQAKAEALLAARFFRHCPQPDCVAFAQGSGREPIPCEPRSACERCGGSDNQRAVTELVELCTKRGFRKLVVVGGSPAVREELERLLDGKLELRLVDGTHHRPVDRAIADLEWADLCLLWGATELHHKVSMQYTNAVPALKKKILHVPKRGIAQLLASAVESLRDRKR